MKKKLSWIIPRLISRYPEGPRRNLAFVHRGFHFGMNSWTLVLGYKPVLSGWLIPAGMIKNQMAINALGQKILIGQGINGDMVMPGMSGFDVVYPNISRKYCVLLLSYQFKEQQLLGLKSITLDNGEEQTVFVWGGENPLPISREQVVSRCKAKNTLLWSFE